MATGHKQQQQQQRARQQQVPAHMRPPAGQQQPPPARSFGPYSAQVAQIVEVTNRTPQQAYQKFMDAGKDVGMAIVMLLSEAESDGPGTPAAA